MKNQKVIVFMLLIVIVSSVSFYTGIQFEKKISASRRSQFFDNNFQMRNPNASELQGNPLRVNRSGLKPVSGEVISSDEQSTTIKLADDTSKIILFSKKTSISKSDSANIADMTPGTKIMVFGTDNQDGSMTANSIQIGRFSNLIPSDVRNITPTKE